jgi:uncharacterized protein (TIGR00251 family)
MAGDPPWTALPGGLALSLRLTPKGGRDAIDGVARLADGRSVLKVRVRAPASDGAANAALVALLARALRTAPRTVRIVAGASGRRKQVTVEGDAASLAAALEKSLAIR